MTKTNQECPRYEKTLHPSADFREVVLILRACCVHRMGIVAPQCAGTNPSIMPITMKITKADRMIIGKENLSIFIRDDPPGAWEMILQQSLLGYPGGYCEYYREWRPGSLT